MFFLTESPFLVTSRLACLLPFLDLDAEERESSSISSPGVMLSLVRVAFWLILESGRLSSSCFMVVGLWHTSLISLLIAMSESVGPIAFLPAGE